MMKISDIRRVKVSVLALVAGISISLAAVNELPVTTARGVKCYYYDVQPKESIYQLTNKLGVSREQIVRLNPSAADGLKPRMRLYFPVSEFESAAGNRHAVYAAAAGVTKHVVKKGETIYGIARQYGMSPDYLAELNPNVADGLKTGDELRIVADAELPGNPQAGSARADKLQPDADGYVRYTIKNGDTLYAIANGHGVTLESVLEANPNVNPVGYKAGEVLLIPVAAPGQSSPAAPVTVVSSAASVTAGTTGSDVLLAPFDPDADEADASVSVPDAERPQMNVAVMLPFMLNETEQSRTTQLYTEFFKGMLMAADTLRNTEGAQVNFRFYDTASSLDTVQSILRRPEIASLDLVVAPDNHEQLTAIVDAVDSETLVFNIFAVKDEGYRCHRNVIQTNIPHDAMYERAIDAFMDKYQGVLPVFLNRNAGLADKDPFVKALKERLTAQGRDFREVNFDNSLSDDDLAAFDPDLTPVVFVPRSGSKTEFARFVRALIAMRERAARPSDVTVFGYPEWITFRGDSFNELCDLDATIYSRFFSSDTDRGIRALKERYKEIYGTEMFEAVPTQGILGYDTGRFIIDGLRQLEETGSFPAEFNGAQSYLKLGWSGATSVDEQSGELSSDGGLVNEALYIINYHPGGIVEWKK